MPRAVNLNPDYSLIRKNVIVKLLEQTIGLPSAKDFDEAELLRIPSASFYSDEQLTLQLDQCNRFVLKLKEQMTKAEASNRILIDQLENQLQLAETKSINSQTRLGKVELERNTLLQEKQQISAQLATLQQSVLTLEQKSAAQLQKLNDQTKEKDLLVADNNKLKQEIILKSQESNINISENNNLKQEITTHLQEIGQLKQDNNRLTLELDAAKQGLTSTQSGTLLQLQTLEKEKQQLLTQLQQLQLDKDAASDLVARQDEKILKLTNDSKAEIQALEKKLQDLEIEYQNLEQSLAVSKQESANVAAQVQSKDNQLSQLQATLTGSNKTLSDELDQSRNQIQTLNSQINQLQNQLNSKQTELTTSLADLNTIRLENENCMKENQNLKSDSQVLQNQLATTLQELTLSKQSWADVLLRQSEIQQQLNVGINNLKKQKERYEDELKAERDKLTEETNKLTQLQERYNIDLQNLQNQLSENVQLADKSRTEREALLNSELLKLKTEASADIAQLTAQLTAANNRITELTEALRKLEEDRQSETATLLSQVSELRQISSDKDENTNKLIETFNGNWEIVQNEKTILEQQVAALQAQVQQAESQTQTYLSGATVEIESVKEENSKIKEQATQYFDQYSQAVEQLREIVVRNTQLEGEILSYQKQAEGLLNQANERDKKYSQLRKTNSNFKSKLAEQKVLIEDLQKGVQQVQECQDNNAKLKQNLSKLDKLTIEVADVKEALSECETNLEDTDTKMDQVRRQLETCQTKASQLGADLQTSQAEAAESDRRTFRLERRNSDLEQEAQTWQTQIQQLKDEIANLQDNIEKCAAFGQAMVDKVKEGQTMLDLQRKESNVKYKDLAEKNLKVAYDLENQRIEKQKEINDLRDKLRDRDAKLKQLQPKK